MKLIVEMLSYPFLVRAFVGGILVSLCAALLGVSLVLKRYSMIGDGLSHVSFGALSVALAAGWAPLTVSIPVVVLAAFFLLRLTENSKVRSDGAIAMISAVSLATGIVATSLTTGLTTDVSSYMFGSILAMTPADVKLSAGLSAVVLGLFKSFKGVVLSSGLVAVVCFCGGMIGSYRFSTPAGASVVLANMGAFGLFWLTARIREVWYGRKK